MRCKDVQAILEAGPEGVLSATIQEHLSACAGCREVRRDVWLMQAGFRSLAEDQPPQASLGFSARVARGLQSAVDSGGATAEFFERIGRRFVLAGLLLTMSLILAFALPSSGPLRGPAPDDPYLTQGEAGSPGESTYLADEFGDTHDATPANSSNGSGQTKK
ncbi:MAG TPA: hypothetical protein VKV95_22685 [Terriglobia bacterium]|nr:hypothetical protein [Terriglobia bacterium]